MNNKLRLVVTSKCHNRCPMCCNNRFDLNELPTIDRLNYDEIMITGGEPMLYVDDVINLVISIRGVAACLEVSPKIYFYTAVPDATATLDALDYMDGAVVTPHTAKDVAEFIKLNKALPVNHCKSLRLNLFPEVKKLFPADIDLSKWVIKEMQWIKDCPVPDGEDLRRINPLFE